MGISGVLRARLHAILVYYKIDLNVQGTTSLGIEVDSGTYLSLVWESQIPDLKRVIAEPSFESLQYDT